MATEYQIIAGDKDQVEAGVTAALADKWDLHGSVAIASGETPQFAQAMTRTAPRRPSSRSSGRTILARRE
jgi:hypothetical protein